MLITKEDGMIKHFVKTTLICTIVVLVAYGIICASHIIGFPSEIRLIEDTQHKLAFRVPLQATIYSESLETLKVNHARINEPVTVFLHDPLWIEASGSGTASMTLNAFGFPIKEVTLDVLPTMEVIPCGITVGVRINTNGVMVLGTGAVRDSEGRLHNPSDGILRPGDLILSANGSDLANKEDLILAIAETEDILTLQVKRDTETIEAVITPIRAANGNMIGSWVRDSTQGIGTITYFNPETNTFGALGHGIMDVDTKRLMSVRSGYIIVARITSVKKGMRGTPGELVGVIEPHNVLGQIKTNSPYGIYGVMENSPVSMNPMPVAKQDQIVEGPATVRTNVIGNEVRDFEIYIESVNRFSVDDTKGMVIRITDPDLLAATNGIVQGMSGSPIMQNGRIIGAVTHVFVQDPTKGYGIFIENMIRQERYIRIHP